VIKGTFHKRNASAQWPLPTVLWVFAFLASGCASIFHGTTQKIQVVTDPPGATAIAGTERVTTPGTLHVPRKAKSAEIRIEKEGYVPQTVRLARRISGLVWTNLGWGVAGVFLDFAYAKASVLTASRSSRENRDDLQVGGFGFTGLGFAIDFRSGGAYRLEPRTVVARLEGEQPPPPVVGR
jgi:hypothetical protein